MFNQNAPISKHFKECYLPNESRSGNSTAMRKRKEKWSQCGVSHHAPKMDICLRCMHLPFHLPFKNIHVSPFGTLFYCNGCMKFSHINLSSVHASTNWSIGCTLTWQRIFFFFYWPGFKIPNPGGKNDLLPRKLTWSLLGPGLLLPGVPWHFWKDFRKWMYHLQW